MNINDIVIRFEKKEDYRTVENLVRESFWNVYRPGCSEHYVLHLLRDDPAFVKELDFCLECVQCGETYFTDEVMEQLDHIVLQARKALNEVVITDYSKAKVV